MHIVTFELKRICGKLYLQYVNSFNDVDINTDVHLRQIQQTEIIFVL